jgi:hypothetical protein
MKDKDLGRRRGLVRLVRRSDGSRSRARIGWVRLDQAIFSLIFLLGLRIFQEAEIEV